MSPSAAAEIRTLGRLGARRSKISPMKKRTPSKPVGALSTTATESNSDGNRRRKALGDFLKRRGLSMAELVKALDIGYGTLLYNHKSGRSEALSVPVVEKILDRFPDATFEELTGRGPRKIAAPDDLRYRPGQSIMLCGEAASGIWALHPRWHRFRWQPLHLPPGVAHPGPGSFAISVGLGAEAALPIGSYVVCKEYQGGTPLSDGLRVVIHRYREKRTEVRLFQVSNDSKRRVVGT